MKIRPVRTISRKPKSYLGSNSVQRELSFFERYPLHVKGGDFVRFATIVRSLRRKNHHERDGFERLVRTACAMNHRGRQRKRALDEVLKGSSETIRQAPERSG